MNSLADGRDRKMRKNRRDKSYSKSANVLFAPDSSIDGANDTVDVEEDLCVEEVPSTQRNFVEMSAAEKLKSQANQMRQALPGCTQIGVKLNKKRKTRRGSGTSSEEERWLDAIESGKLEQVDDELKKIKDPKLMTARQRAMYERSIEKDVPCDALLALPTGYKEKVLTAEALEKAQLKSQKRKQLADEKREKDKRKTMDRLLKKQESKVTKVSKNRVAKVSVPVISYHNSAAHGPMLCFPKDAHFPLQPQKQTDPPVVVFCAICKDNQKRYNCSKTNIPLCSFKCYLANC